MTLTTLAAVRELVERHLPRHCRERDTCQHVAKLLHLAVRCDDINDAVIALRLMLQLHGCRACRNKTRPRKQP
jgi:hypothetical protein